MDSPRPMNIYRFSRSFEALPYCNILTSVVSSSLSKAGKPKAVTVNETAT